MLVRFEDEARVEFRESGRRYEARVTGLGLEFFDEVDATLRQVMAFPKTGSRVPRDRFDFLVGQPNGRLHAEVSKAFDAWVPEALLRQLPTPK